MSYDVIGDIHGCSRTLECLLRTLGYARDSGGVYRHDYRSVIFLGDFIDRGPHQREVISIVRSMIDAGAARTVMGNHEYNAIAYATVDEAKRRHLRAHSDKNRRQHSAFLEAYAGDSDGYRDVIAWFRTLPVWLDLGDLRVIHACWDKQLVRRIGAPVMTEELLRASCDKDQWQHAAVETMLKGKEILLPQGRRFHDKDGNPRHHIRVRWWDSSATTHALAYLGPESARMHIPNGEIEGDHLIEYPHEEPPVFFGHYWMEAPPASLAPGDCGLHYGARITVANSCDKHNACKPIGRV